MSFDKLRDTVLINDLCAGCGLCGAVCPKDLIDFEGHEPVLRTAPEACGDCILCHDVCPGADPATPAAESHIFGRQRTFSERWIGIHRKVHHGYSTDPVLFERSASGGGITGTLMAARDRLQLGAVLAVGRSTTRPAYAEGVICRTDEEILETCQSSYQLFPYLRKLRRLLQAPEAERIAVAGLACHVQAIRKLQMLDCEIGERARERIGFIVEAACSSNTLPSGTDAMLREEVGVTLNDTKRLRYREGSYPGEIRGQTADGRDFAFPFWKAVRHLKASKTHRCLSCGDWFSGLADVAVCDGDQNIFATSQNGTAPAKYAKILVRTPLGEDVVEWAAATGRMVLWPGSIDDANSLGCERKRNRRASYELRGGALPAGPILGYIDRGPIIDDEFLIPDMPDQSRLPDKETQ